MSNNSRTLAEIILEAKRRTDSTPPQELPQPSLKECLAILDDSELPDTWKHDPLSPAPSIVPSVKPTKLKRRRVTLRLPEWMIEQTDKWASERGTTRSHAIRRWIEIGISENLGPAMSKAPAPADALTVDGQ
jgi:hypothetical protein